MTKAIEMAKSCGINCCTNDGTDRLIEAFAREVRNDCMLPVFDGYAVYCAMDEMAKKRTSYENVSDTLDALAKLLRERV